MKKILNINLSGRVIPIEDSAYENLQAYIESLRKYFANEEGRDEIINDIESRIAELMSEKVRKGAACITDADVEEIAISMGRPQDFEAEDIQQQKATAASASAASSSSQSFASSESNTQSQSYTPNFTRPASEKKRLYRDTSDKFIGGVCSGLANYMNIDPAIVRILFAIITFGGFGLGILLYIVMWIVLPPKDLDEFGGKRLFRNPDVKVIGGVAGGLSAYFDIDAWKIRLIFLAPMILSAIFGTFFDGPGFEWDILSGSLTGTFVLAYIILWAVLPEARSPYEKMEMRGEKVDVNTIKQTVQEGMGTMKDKVKGWSGEVKEAAERMGNKAKEFSNTRGKAFVSEVREASKPVRSGLGHAIGVIFKAFFLFIAGSIAFALFVALISLIFSGAAWWPINNYLWTSNAQQVYAWGTIMLFLGVPLIGFLIWIIRRIIGVRSRNSYLGWIFGGLWVLGWVSVALLGSSISRDFSDSATINNEVQLNAQPANGRMKLIVSEPELVFNSSFWWTEGDWDGWNVSSDTMRLSWVRFVIDKSSDANYHVSYNKVSQGRTESEARRRAEKIQYTVSYKDSILDLGSGFAIDKDSKYRGQRIEIRIEVPVGKRIRFDESVRYKLNPMNVKIRRGRNWRNNDVDFEFNNYRGFPWMSNTDYIMGENGELKNADGTPVSDYNNYRYNNNPNDSNALKEKEKRLRDELKQIEEQRKAKPDTNRKVSAKLESEENTDSERSKTSKGLPLLSLENFFY
jgi:phage shock protein PspC (stress-responsive transcriptional regulator)